MQCVRLPDNRAGLAFDFNKNWERTNADAIAGSTRERILRDWKQFPQWLRQDHGFQCLMDHFDPYRNVQVAASGDDFRMPSGEPTDEEVQQIILRQPTHHACVDLVVPFATVATVAVTAKTIVGVKCRSNQSVDWWGNVLGFDGTATNAPPLVEFCQSTWATQAPGTNSTSVTPVITDSGRPETPQSLGGKNWSVEPTVLTKFDNMLVPNNGAGPAILFAPMTKKTVLTSSIGGVIRVTQPSGVSGNATGAMKITE